MNLGEFIEKLAAVADQSKVCSPGLARPHSWRGIYAEVAFAPAESSTVSAMLAEAKGAVGATYQGWKGGDYQMSLHTPMHIEERGEYTDGGCAAEFVLKLDGSVDVEGRTEEWLVAKAVGLMLSK